ncbi:class I SAM-dependent methyltransferase [uncultured Mucilaginibacter sp.]|uniref:class I SAM-dependent methyltransferase n=1 Tax=uncultured Mucilaginibacter sp. TaxID=797541 RepID=UPI0025DEE5C2|nr:class I SAM-dependent methyltransferase [uncultured Mucilaginibacter sp.]
MASNYDNSAWFYDGLSRVVYGNALISSQVYLLQFIPSNATILIVGGGTGRLLEEIAKIYPSGLNITYVEISAKMMAIAKKKNHGNNRVTFINEAVENVPFSLSFDVVITPFLFDNFTEKTLQTVFNHINSLLKTDGIWLCSDFQITGALWQRALLKTMYIFFKLLCRIETTTMPNIEAQFNGKGYKKKSAKTFFADFIISTEYQKSCLLILASDF